MNNQFLKSNLTKQDIYQFLSKYYPNLDINLQFIRNATSKEDIKRLFRNFKVKDTQFLGKEISKQEFYNIINSMRIPSSGLKLWHDAADTSTIITDTVFGKVDTWLDKSGSGNHSTQTIPTAKPTSGITTLNGLNVLDFDGSDALNVNANLFSIPLSNSTLFVVCKINTETGINQDIFALRSTFVSYGIRYLSPGTNISFIHGNGSSLPATRTNWNLISCYNETNNVAISLNGGAFNITINGFADTPITGQIGANGSNFFFMNGSIAEIILYDRKLSNDEINTVNSYLMTKHNL